MKRKHLSVQDKYDAIKAVERGELKARVAERFGATPSAVSTWTKPEEKKKIVDAIESGTFGPRTKNLKSGQIVEIDKALLIWLREAREKNLNISGPVLKAKALVFAEKLGFTDFKASTGWLDRFKARHGLVYRTIRGESKGVNQEVVEQFRSVVLPQIFAEFKPCDIYNADESGLYIRAQQDKTWTFSDDSGHGMKVSKKRLTVLFTANADGSDKKEPIVIGKYANPRCFKGKVLPCPYRANNKAWMTSTLWEEWLRSWDRELIRQKRKVALVVDNAPGHPSLKLENIRLFYLPPNTTSSTQPMDMGIIANVKHWYRSIFSFQHLIPALDNKEPLAFDVYKALTIIVEAWKRVSSRTISRCFRKAGFGEPNDDDSDDDEGLPLSELAARMSAARGEEFTENDAHRFLTEEEGLPTSGEMDDNDIVNTVRERSTEPDEDEDIPRLFKTCKTQQKVIVHNSTC